MDAGSTPAYSILGKLRKCCIYGVFFLPKMNGFGVSDCFIPFHTVKSVVRNVVRIDAREYYNTVYLLIIL